MANEISALGREAWRQTDLGGLGEAGRHQPQKLEIFAFVDQADAENEARRAEVVTERVARIAGDAAEAAARQTGLAAIGAAGNFAQIAANFAALTLVADANDLALTVDTGAIYYKIGATGAGSWALAFDPVKTSMEVARAVAATMMPADYNWFNKAEPTVLLDTNISSADSSTFAAAGFFTTHLVPVQPGGAFVPKVGVEAGFFFDHRGVATSTCGAVAVNTSKAVPAGSCFVKLGINGLANLDNLAITWGTVGSAAYAPHGVLPMLPHKGKALYCLGDSQTYNLPGYQTELALRTGAALTANGWPGRTFEGLAAVITAGEDEDTPANPVDITGAKIINVVLGANDWSAGLRDLGTIADAPGAASLFGDMGAVLAAIRAVNDTALVMFTGPGPRAAVDTLPASPNGVHPTSGLTLKQVNDAIAAFCAFKSLPFCNLLENLSWDPDLLATKTSDGVHWSTGDGATDAGRQMGAKMNRL